MSVSIETKVSTDPASGTTARNNGGWASAENPVPLLASSYDLRSLTPNSLSPCLMLIQHLHLERS